jgi:hypothetical protein
MKWFALMVLSARNFKPIVFAILISIPAKIVGMRLISMMGSAIDLHSLEATLNVFEMLSGDRVGGDRPFLLFQAFISARHCEFWMKRLAFFGPHRDR